MRRAARGQIRGEQHHRQQHRVGLLGQQQSIRGRQHRRGVDDNEVVLFLEVLENADQAVLGQRLERVGIQLAGRHQPQPAGRGRADPGAAGSVQTSTAGIARRGKLPGSVDLSRPAELHLQRARGAVFASVFNVVFWFLTMRHVDKHHPAIKSGDLPKYDRNRPFIQSMLRNLAYGLVLGVVYGNAGRSRR